MNNEQPANKEINQEIKETKQCRVELDAALQNVKKLLKSRETSLAITNIQQGIMWLGMHLKEVGNPNPYPESYNPQSTVVSPTADNLKL